MTCKSKSFSMFLILILVFSSIIMVKLANAQATTSNDDWPMFRHDSVHLGVATTTGPTKGDKLWTYMEGGSTEFFIESSPTVVNGIVYVGSNWNNKVGSIGANVFAFNAYTGAKIWNFPTQGPVYSSPAVSGNRVFIGVENEIYCLNALSGAKVWSFATGGRIASSPAVVNDIVYVGSEDDNVYALNAKTGTEIWNYTTGGPIDSSPAVTNGIVYIGTYGSEEPNVYALNASSGSKIWNFKNAFPFTSSPAISEGILYIGSGEGNVYALNATTGEKIWSFTAFKITKNEGIEASPAVADGVVYIGSEGGGLYALNASTGTQIWNIQDFFIVYSSAAVSNGIVYINSDALNASTGSNMWSVVTTRSDMRCSPAIANGIEYFSYNGTFYAIGELSTAQLIQVEAVWIFLAVALVIVVVGLLVYFKKHKHKRWMNIITLSVICFNLI